MVAAGQGCDAVGDSNDIRGCDVLGRGNDTGIGRSGPTDLFPQLIGLRVERAVNKFQGIEGSD
jgi:hypothetical protein